MDDVKPERQYHSPLREERAQSTRRTIVDAARNLFAERGYGATTVQMIADQAGVAVQTIYSSLGSKRAIVSAMIDQIEEQADMTPMHQAMFTTDDPREQIRLQVSFGRRLFGNGYDVINTIQGAGTVDPDMASAWDEGNARHRSGQQRLVNSWKGRELLREGLGAAQAADILATMTSFDVYRWLVIDCRWSGDEYERWLNATLPELILRSNE